MPASPEASQPAASRLRLTRRMRMLTRTDFDRAMKAGLRLIDERFVCWVAANGLDHARLGLVVGRRYGTAPQRNRAKRLIREAFRLGQHDLPAGIDFAFCPKIGVALTLADVRSSVRRLAERAARRVHSADT